MHMKITITPEADGDLYPMCDPQPAQIDCRVVDCQYNGGAGKCRNIAPALTLNDDKTFVCWSRYSDEEEELDDLCEPPVSMAEYQALDEEIHELRSSLTRHKESCDAQRAYIRKLEKEPFCHRVTAMEYDKQVSINKGLHTQIARYQVEMDKLRTRLNEELEKQLPNSDAMKERENLLHEELDRLRNRNARMAKELEAYKQRHLSGAS